MNIDWTLFNFIFDQQDELFDEITIRNNMDNYTQFVNLIQKIEGPYTNSKFGVGFKLPNIWDSALRRGVLKSNLFYLKNNDNSNNFHLNLKALKWDTSYLFYLGAMNHLRDKAFDTNIFGGAFYKVNPGVIIGLNTKIRNAVKSEKINVEVKPSVIINALDFSAELSAESILKDNKINMIYIKKPELSTNLMPYVNFNASYTWATKGLLLGGGVSFTKFWIFSRLGFNYEHDFGLTTDRLGLYGASGPLNTKLYYHKREKENASIGLDLEFKDTRDFIKQLSRANLHFGVSADKWNNGFLGLNLDFN